MYFNVRALSIVEWNDEELYRKLREFTFNFYDKYDKTLNMHTVRHILEQSYSYFIVAETNDKKIIGMCICNTILTLGRASFTIDEVYVDPKFRGHSVGTGMINFCIDLAKKRGYDSIELVVNEDNEAAIKLYSSCGFEEKPKKFMTKILKEWRPKYV